MSDIPMSRPDLPEPSRLWRHMQDTYGISLLVSEEADIVNAVNEDHHHALEAALAERDEARADADEWQNKYAGVFVERDEARGALKRIADCDWVITLPDRMDAVRKIARDALEVAK